VFLKNKALLLLLIILIGCVYYNTFFNAKKYFQLAQDTPLRSGRPTAAAMTHYTKAIQRCAYIIEEYPNSKWVDDSLFLLGKCFYYRGNSFRQAIETLEELIGKFPQSEFTPPAYLYIARSLHELKTTDLAKNKLNELISNPNYQAHHAEALLLLATYYLQENNFGRAEHFLQIILSDYPRSKEYESTFLLLGKTHQEAKNYEKSNEVLHLLTKARVNKIIKLEARFLIAKNYYAQNKFQDAIEICEKLINEQYSEEERAKSKLLLARNYAGIEEFEKAKDLFLLVIHENPRSLISAAANFFLGEMYFSQLHEYQNAIEYYNKVRTESSASEHVANALTKSAIASQIVQYRSASRELDLVNLADQQFKLAEYYIFELDYPDSALVIYDEIMENKFALTSSIDSLQITINELSHELIQEYPSFYEKRDSLAVAIQLIRNDTLLTDSTRTYLIDKTQTLTNSNIQMNNRQANLRQFQEEIGPFAFFSKIWVYEKIIPNRSEAEALLRQMKRDFPDNKYTQGADKLLQGENVTFVTTQEKQQIAAYQQALDTMKEAPQNSVPIFLSIIENENHPYFQESLYSLGFIHYFQLSDSTIAKTYFDSLIHLPQFKEPLVRKLAIFYDGDHFKPKTSLKALEKYQVQPEEETEETKDIESKDEAETENKIETKTETKTETIDQ
jgi:TolA-binding protein